jgi:hypothetical protein
MQLEIQNPLHRLYMFLVLQAEFGRPDGRETAKLMAGNVALGLDRPNEGGVGNLLAEFDASAEQEECRTVLAAFYKTHVSVHHHPPVRKLKPISPERIAPPEVRRGRMEKWGYDFRGFWKEGNWFGLPRILGVGAAGLDASYDSVILNEDPAEYAHMLNLLNGGAFFDYEAAFPECADIFRAIKIGKFHMSEAEADDMTGRSALSTADIMLGVLFGPLNADVMPDVTRKRAMRAVSRILDSNVGNDERGILHHELRTVFGVHERGLPELEYPLMHGLESRVHELPPPHLLHVDVVITLNGGDLGAATYKARQTFGDSFFMPIGGQSPHQAKEGLGELAAYSESDEMRATLLLHDYRSPFEAYPDHPIDGRPPRKLSTYDVLPSDHVSIDTASNAAQAAPRLALVAKLLGRPLNIAVASAGIHALRARTEFREALSPEIAKEVYTFPVRETAIHTNGFRHFKPVAIGQTFCEYLKRLYAVSVA